LDAARTSSNLELWKRGGDTLLLVQPFMDSVVVRGEGAYLIDADGRRILDLAAGQFCSILGHSHQKFIARLQHQLETLVHLGDQYVSPGVLDAAARLAAVAPPGLNKVIFLSTGSEAVECAMQIAKSVTRRTGVLAFTRGYHGSSLATRNLTSISDVSGKAEFQPAPINQHQLLTPTCDRCPIQLTYPACQSACLDVSVQMLGPRLDNLAAVIVEPVLSAGGMIFPPKGYLQRLFEMTRSLGALFIVDEAQTGFGRCGHWFDIEHSEIEPDILVVSKTAGNGYPVAAVVTSDSVAARVEARGFSHLSSHQNDPLAAAAVHAVIDIVEDERLVDHSRQMGDYFIGKLKGLQAKHPLVSNVRGRGLMIALELSGPSPRVRAGDIALSMALLCESKGLHLTFSYSEPVIRIIPPLIIAAQDIGLAIDIIDDALGSLENGPPDLAHLAPRNHRSGPLIRRMNRRFSPKRFLHRMWETSPQEWLRKLNAES